MRAFDFVITLYLRLRACPRTNPLDGWRHDPRREAPSLLVGQCRLDVQCASGNCRLVAEPMGPQDRTALGHGYRPRVPCRRVPALCAGTNGQRTNSCGGASRFAGLPSGKRPQECPELCAIECAITIGTVFLYGSTSQNWVASNWATAPTLVASVAAALTSNRWVQAVAIAVIMLLWVPYFVTLQGALS